MSKNTIYIGNLNYKISKNDLTGIFGKFGKVGKVNLIIDPKTNQSKGIAFVELFGKDSSKNAIAALDGKEIDGRIVKVSVAKENKPSKTPKSEIDVDKTIHTIHKEKNVRPLVTKRPKQKKGLELLFANISK